MKIYNFKQKIGQDIYRKILDYSLIQTSKMVFVDIDAYGKKNNLDQGFIRLISPHILKKQTVLSWPGTIKQPFKNSEYKGEEMYVLNANPNLIQEIKLLIPTLWDWQGPKYPEDLRFLRPDGTPWFVSITHEDDAYVELEDSELKAFTEYFGNDLIEYFKEDENVTKYL